MLNGRRRQCVEALTTQLNRLFTRERKSNSKGPAPFDLGSADPAQDEARFGFLFRGDNVVTAAVVSLGLGLAQAAAAAPASISLCGHTAPSQTQLYFDLAKSPFARILRATEQETILQDEASGILWTFVIDPVSLVTCRSEAKPDDLDTHCDGEATVCASLIERLKADPRAQP